jgi:hypothetical protein
MTLHPRNGNAPKVQLLHLVCRIRELTLIAAFLCFSFLTLNKVSFVSMRVLRIYIHCFSLSRSSVNVLYSFLLFISSVVIYVLP